MTRTLWPNLLRIVNDRDTGDVRHCRKRNQSRSMFNKIISLITGLIDDFRSKRWTKAMRKSSNLDHCWVFLNNGRRHDDPNVNEIRQEVQQIRTNRSQMIVLVAFGWSFVFVYFHIFFDFIWSSSMHLFRIEVKPRPTHRASSIDASHAHTIEPLVQSNIIVPPVKYRSKVWSSLPFVDRVSSSDWMT